MNVRKLRLVRNFGVAGVIRAGWFFLHATAVASFLFAASVSAAQERASVVRSTSVTPCAGCTLQIDSVTTLGVGDEERATFDHFVLGVVITPAREFVVIGNTVPSVFDLHGRFLRALGRKGSGPGEFPQVANRVSVSPNGDLSFFTPRPLVVMYRADGTFLRQVQLAHTVYQPVRLPDDKIVARNPWFQKIPDGSVVDQPRFFLLDEKGKMIRNIDRGITSSDGSVIAGTKGSFWTWQRAPFVLRNWSQNGVLLSTFTRVIPTFDAKPFRNEGLVYVQPRVTSVFESRDGLLWVSYFDGGPPESCHPPLERCWSSVLEVLDPSSGALIASKRLPFRVSEMISDGYLGSYTNTGFSMGSEPAKAMIYSVKLIRTGAARTRK